MTREHPVRRMLARVCSSDTMARVVDPTLADMACERGRPAWRGYGALARALMLHGAVSVPGWTVRIWQDDAHAIPKVAGLAALAAVMAAGLLTVPPMLQFGAPSVTMAVLLAPQALALTWPAALLIAVPMALKNQKITRRLIGRTIALSVCAIAVTAVLMRIMPDANQTFRVLASGKQDISRGPNELHFTGLRERIEVLNLTPGGRPAARHMEYLFQLRLALVCAALPLGLLSLGVSASVPGRRRPALTGLALLVGYAAMLFAVGALGATVVGRAAVLPFVIAWTPTIAMIALAASVWRCVPPDAPAG